MTKTTEHSIEELSRRREVLIVYLNEQLRIED